MRGGVKPARIAGTESELRVPSKTGRQHWSYQATGGILAGSPDASGKSSSRSKPSGSPGRRYMALSRTLG